MFFASSPSTELLRNDVFERKLRARAGGPRTLPSLLSAVQICFIGLPVIKRDLESFSGLAQCRMFVRGLEGAAESAFEREVRA